MATARGTIRRAVALSRRMRTGARNLRPLTSHVLRPVLEQTPPPPSAFASFGDNAWLVPPIRVENPHRISIGDGAVVLEQGTLRVLDDGEGEPLLVFRDRAQLARFSNVICEVGIEIGEDVASSDSVTIIDTWRVPVVGAPPRRDVPPPGRIVIGRGAYLAMGSVIGPGVTVGEGAYIGENAVVFDDVPAFSVVRGNPATVVRRFEPDAQAWTGRPWP